MKPFTQPAAEHHPSQSGGVDAPRAGFRPSQGAQALLCEVVSCPTGGRPEPSGLDGSRVMVLTLDVSQ